jgi:very-short-patch-repair endonuclease
VHVAQLDPRSVRRHEGLPVTSPARTLLDLGRWVHADLVEWAMDFCLRNEMTSWRELERLVSAMAGRARRGPATLRTILALRGEPRRYTDSLLETQFFQLMRYARLPAPRLQHPIMEGRRRVARVDFAWPEANLTVETVGHRAHGVKPWQFKRDARRSTEINRLRRFTVFTFTWDDVHHAQHSVCRTVAEPLGIRWDPSPEVARDIAEFAARLAVARVEAPGGARPERQPRAAGSR